jgi:Mg2+/citrate symporter
MLAVPYIIVGMMIAFVIYANPTELKDLWPVILAYFGIPLTLLRMYFGVLRNEHAHEYGQPYGLAALSSVIGGKNAN